MYAYGLMSTRGPREIEEDRAFGGTSQSLGGISCKLGPDVFRLCLSVSVCDVCEADSFDRRWGCEFVSESVRAFLGFLFFLFGEDVAEPGREWNGEARPREVDRDVGLFSLKFRELVRRDMTLRATGTGDKRSISTTEFEGAGGEGRGVWYDDGSVGS